MHSINIKLNKSTIDDSVHLSFFIDLLYDLEFDDPDNTNFNWETLPMVIGASSNHYKESLAAVEAHHNMFPKSTMYYYDLGLKEQEVQAVS